MFVGIHIQNFLTNDQNSIGLQVAYEKLGNDFTYDINA